jgi:leucyl-tRNA synthetase
VNPDDMVKKYGADCFRMYEMFLGPIEQSKPWDTNGIEGVQKFLRKFWSIYYNENGLHITDDTPVREEVKVLHQTIKKVTDDIERFSFNTAVSAFMVCVNELKRLNCNKREVLQPLVRLLAPFAPFITEQIWFDLGEQGSVHHSDFPVFDPACLESDAIEYPVSINGKKRDVISIPSAASQDEIKEIVLQSPMVQKWLEGQQPKKCIIVPGRMINLVV